MKFGILILMFAFPAAIFSQEKTTKFYNPSKQMVPKEKATMYSLEYFNSAKQRIYKEFFDISDNTLQERGYYINDSTADGLLVKYINDKQVWDSGYLSMGHRSGLTYFYHNNGKLASVIDFKGDTTLMVECYDEKGTAKECEKGMEIMPEFPGNVNGLIQFLKSNIIYPKDARKKGIEGKVIVKFYIDTDGKVKGAKIIKSVYPSIDEETLRLINEMPDWKPGSQYGRNVKVY